MCDSVLCIQSHTVNASGPAPCSVNHNVMFYTFLKNILNVKCATLYHVHRAAL